jgi:hypothetical protein
MSSVRRTAFVAILTFASSMAGYILQWLVPTQYIVDSKGAVGAVVGLVTLLLALVLGLLIWTSYGVFTTQQTEAQGLSSTVLQLDLLLERYGPEAKPGRVKLKEQVLRSRKRFFEHRDTGPETFTFAESRHGMLDIENFFASLNPPDDEKRQMIATAKGLANSVVQTQLLMSRQLVNPVPIQLIIVVLCWSSLLFLGFGLLANFTIISVVADAFGAVSVASAMFLILEFSQPYSGVFTISSQGIDAMLRALVDESAAA